MNRMFVALSLAMLSTASYAGITKWVDAQGTVHYSDAPPQTPAANQQQLNITTGGASADSRKAKTAADKELEFRQRRVDAEEAKAKKEKSDELALQKKKNCTASKDRLATLEEGGRIFTRNAAGEREYMDDKAREKALADAKKESARWCS